MSKPNIISTMNEESSQQASNDSLRELLRNVSVVQARQYFACEDIEWAEAPDHLALGQVLKRYIVMVLLTGAKIRFVFKVHFNPEQVRTYRQTAGCKPEDLSDKHLIDFMKELSNQIGGRVCRVFDTHGMSLGMSIPLCTRGIYEIYASYEAKAGAVNKFGDFWRLRGPFGDLYCSCYVEIMTKESFSNIAYTDEPSNEGELDFL
ncbi:MAG: hypothetical protein KGL90_00050 [Burkholderiales bacterium]|nr:hypothetical protein [Burkholderiales bacterium]